MGTDPRCNFTRCTNDPVAAVLLGPAVRGGEGGVHVVGYQHAGPWALCQHVADLCAAHARLLTDDQRAGEIDRWSIVTGLIRPDEMWLRRDSGPGWHHD